MRDDHTASGACRHGLMRWPAEDADAGRALAIYGEWRENELAFLLALSPPGGRVVDAGAGIGAFSLAFARAAGHLDAIEPDAAPRRLLAENLADNGLAASGGTAVATAGTAAGVAVHAGVAAAADALAAADLVRVAASLPAADAAAAVAAAGPAAVVAVEIDDLGRGTALLPLLSAGGRRVVLAAFAAYDRDNFRDRAGNVFGFRQDAVLVGLPPGRALPGEGADGATAAALVPIADELALAAAFVALPREADATADARDLAALRRRLAATEARLAETERALAVAERRAKHFAGRDRDARNDLLGEFGQTGLLRRRRGSELKGHHRILARSGLFDPVWYVATYPDVGRSKVDPLVHYLLVGGFEGRKPNPYFDSAHYLERYPDLAESGLNPLVHYALHGGREGRDCGGAFDGKFYLAANPDVAASGEHPMAHYLRVGRKEGRAPVPRPVVERGEMPKAPPAEAWAEIARTRRPAAMPAVDVVVPVYRGYDDTLACLHAVMTAPTATPFDLVVVDDASPEPALSAELSRLAGLKLITLLVNAPNRGFVGSTNRGMALHPDRDVVLLNSDTVVYNDWLDRLRAQATKPGVGTVTPLSNNATICSYPHENRDNTADLEIGYAALDRLAAEVNAGDAVEVPTGVGFCMYVRRAVLDTVGLFDEAAFGRGYGEENDLCRRAAAAGFVNVLATDVFVRHTGEVSFAADASGGKAAGLKAVLDRHPDYLDRVHAYIAAKPAAAARRRLDAARLKRLLPQAGAVAFVTHAFSGGVVRHLDDMAAMLAEAGLGAVILAPRRDDRGGRIGIDLRDGLDVPNLAGLDVEADFDALAAALASLGVRQIHVHSLVEWPQTALERLPLLAGALGVPLDFTFHDYLAVCPRINMIDETGVFCGVHGWRACNACENRAAPPPGAPDIDVWRERYRRFVVAARHLYAPSRDTAERLAGYFPDRLIRVMPHVEPEPPAVPAAAARAPGERLRVAIIGAIGPHKGSALVLAMAEDARARALPLDFVLVGHSDVDAALAGLATITGRYSEEAVDGLLAAQRCHVALIPSVWPETYCYTLSIALRNGFPVAVFDLGAQRERLVAADPERAIVLPLAAMADARLSNDLILAGAARFVGAPARPAPGLAGPAHTFESYYGT